MTNTIPLSLLLLALGTAPAPAPAADGAAAPVTPDTEVTDARRQLDDAIRALDDARARLNESRAESVADRARLRAELSRAHEALRDASREIARAHRDLAFADPDRIVHLRGVNLGDRPVLGVLLGEASRDGIRIVGVSPDGPAERAGIRAGDLLVSIRNTELTGHPGDAARDALFAAMDDVGDGDEVPIAIVRRGQRLDIAITAERREPASWQSLIRVPLPAPDAPEAPAAPAAPDATDLPDEPDAPEAPYVVIDRIELPGLDHEQLHQQIDDIEQQLRRLEYRFVDENGNAITFGDDFPGNFPDNFAGLSDFGAHALDEASLWFRLSPTRGLELVRLNPGLGRYFEADRGVLVVSAESDNAYDLEAGDVIQAVGDTSVDRPADLLRALRALEPGSEVKLSIKRDRRERTLEASLPDERFGLGHPGVPPPPVAPKGAPTPLD